MYDKLERLKYYLEGILEERELDVVSDMINDMERELEITSNAYEYLNDEDNYQ